MKRFNYADEKISSAELMIAIPSVIIGIGILSLPRSLAKESIAADGWIPLVVAGLILMFMAWNTAKLATLYPGKSFVEYTSILTTKPVAIVLTLGFSVLMLLQGSHQVRSISDLGKKYLFDRTPPEMIGLAFLLVVIYAVAGSRVGLFRLNMMFFPLIIIITVIVLTFSAGAVESGHLQPMFQTSKNDYWNGLKVGVFAYLGFSILFFYPKLLRRPKKAPKMALIGMAIPIVVYVSLYIVTIGVFGNSITSNLIYPTIELAKSVEVPGEFFERFESVFFVIWTMAIFNTTSIIMDVMVFSFMSVFKNITKLKVLYIASPIMFFISAIPKDVVDVERYITVIDEIMGIYIVFIIIMLFFLSKIRRRQ